MALIYGQLVRAALEVLSSNPSAATTGRIWWNSTDGKAYADDSSLVRAFIRNDAKAIVGNAGTAADNIRLHRGAAGVLQFVTGSDATAEGTLSTALNQISARQENYAFASLPAFGNVGRLAFTSDTLKLYFDTGAAWVKVASGVVSIADGGTGQITASAAFDALAPSQGGNSGKFLTTNGTTASWAFTSATVGTTNVSANYTVLTTDNMVNVDASGGAITLSLYTASGNTGKVLYLKKTDTSFNAVTIDPSGAETVGGSSTTTLNTQGEMLVIVSDGTNWNIIERYIPSGWTTYTINITGSVSDPSKASSPDADVAAWSRQGSKIIIKYNYQHTTNTGSAAGSGNYLYSLPSGLAVDTSLVTLSNGSENFGDAAIQYLSNVYNGWVTYIGGSTGKFGLFGNNAGTGFVVGSASTPLNGTTVIYSFTAIIPISGWNA